MGDDKETKSLVYLLDADVHEQHLNLAKEDYGVITSHLHDHTASDAINPDGLVSDLCEYLILLNGFVELLDGIAATPKTPGENSKENYILSEQDGLILKFYLPMLSQFEQRVRSYGLSLSIH